MMQQQPVKARRREDQTPTMARWLKMHLTDIRTNIAAGRSDLVERRYLPLAVLLGLVMGVISSFATLVAVPILVVFGFLAGYAARSYVSHRRRIRHYLRTMEDQRRGG